MRKRAPRQVSSHPSGVGVGSKRDVQTPFVIHYQKVHMPDWAAMTESYHKERQEIQDELAELQAQYTNRRQSGDRDKGVNDNDDNDDTRTNQGSEASSVVMTPEEYADRQVFDDTGVYSKDVFLADQAVDYCPYRFDVIQSYHPLLQHFFVMTQDNYHKVALNHGEQMHTLDEVIHTETRQTCGRDIFIKFAPMLDPYQFLNGNYNMERQSWRQLPHLQSTVDNDNWDHRDHHQTPSSTSDPLHPLASHAKLMDPNNCSYVDMFFTFLLGKLREQHKLVFAQRFYGAFLGIQDKFRYNVALELECLEYSSFFQLNNGKYFTYQPPRSQSAASLPQSSLLYCDSAPTVADPFLEGEVAVIPTEQLSMDTPTNDATDTAKETINAEESGGIQDMEEVSLSLDMATIHETSSSAIANPPPPLLRLQRRKHLLGGKEGTLNRFASSCFADDDDYDDPDNNNNSDNDNDDVVDDSSSGSSRSDVDSLYSNSEDEDEDEDEVDESKEPTEKDGEQESEEVSRGSGSGGLGGEAAADAAGENESCSSSQYYDDDDEYVPCYLHHFPVMVIAQDRCQGTLDELLPMSEDETLSALIQVVMMLLAYQKMFDFTHNDLHSNNIMYTHTERTHLYYVYDKQLYKVPTFGRIYHIIDFGRAIYRFKDRLFCSDSFQPKVGDAFAQYNTEPYFDSSKPRIDPNRSFDLCRLGCSLYPKLVPPQDWCKPLTKRSSPVLRLVLRWCTDDFGKNILLKRNGTERYAGFKLYKMIARTVTRRTPQAEIRMAEFAKFSIRHPLAHKSSGINPMNLDELPVYYSLSSSPPLPLSPSCAPCAPCSSSDSPSFLP